MAVDVQLAHTSDTLLFVAVVGYSVAMLGFAAELSFGRRRSVAAQEPARVPAQVGGGVDLLDRPAPPARRGAPDSAAGRAAIALTIAAFGLHVAAAVTRGLAAHRVPWGNMYEFSTMTALVAVGAFLALLTRERVRLLGAFVLLVVVVLLGLAGTVLYVPAGPLVPALQSYWIKIHVAAAILASGTFTVGAVVTVLYLLRARHEADVAGARATALGNLGRSLPSASTLDRVSYRVHAFAFPVWTFAIIAGAIWAEAAWGRYWGWDPKETWSFITWVIYAGYLHARTTAGWRGGKAGGIALLGFSALTVDYYIVNIFLVGLHSYAGV